jgi:chromosome segregation ATPase
VELNEDMENLRKKNQTEILEIKSSLNQMKNAFESHSSRLEQVEDRISGLKDKIDIKEKTEEFLDKKIQELHNNWRLNTTLLNDQ